MMRKVLPILRTYETEILLVLPPNPSEFPEPDSGSNEVVCPVRTLLKKLQSRKLTTILIRANPGLID